MRELIVTALERACVLVHDRDPFTLFLWTPWSTNCRLATWAFALMGRWGIKWEEMPVD